MASATDNAKPSIICVPPPDVRVHGSVFAIFWLLFFVAIGYGLTALVGASIGENAPKRLILLTAWALGVVSAIITGRMIEDRNRRSREFLARHDFAKYSTLDVHSLPRATISNPTKVRDTLQQAGLFNSAGAHIVCFGTVEVPKHSGESAFTPELIMPKGSVLGLRTLVPTIALLCVLWALASAFLLPRSMPVSVHYTFSGLVAGTVLMRLFFQPKSVFPPLRLAPGRIDVHRYGYFHRIPEIRSYPMQAGTLAILSDHGGCLVLTLARDGFMDTIRICLPKYPPWITSHLWQAMLATPQVSSQSRTNSESSL